MSVAVSTRPKIANAGPIPIVHSVLDGRALGREIRSRYGLTEPFDCELLVRGVNDVYVVTAGSARYAARVWRANFRTSDQVAFELAFLLHLKEAGIPVVAPLRSTEGGTFFLVEAPEGTRQVALFDWVKGTSFANIPTAAVAEKIGAGMAQIHLAARSFVPPARRPIEYRDHITENLPLVLRRLADRPADAAFYPRYAEAILKGLDQPAARALPRHAIHGDFHARNVFADQGGNIEFLDFDAAGEAPALQDIVSYVWATPYIARDVACAGLTEEMNDRFMAGYRSVRPLTADEEKLLPLYIAAKEMVFLGAKFAGVGAQGPNTFLLAGWDWFAQRARRHAAEAGFAIS